MASGSQPDPRQDRPCAQVNVGNWVAHRTAATARLGWDADVNFLLDLLYDPQNPVINGPLAPS